MDAVDIWSVMKWVLLVLLAGFIAQFGKAVAQSVLKKAGKEKAPAAVSHAEPPVKFFPSPQQTIITPPDHPITGAGMEKAPQITTAKTEKKLIKAMAKQKKKEAKSLK
jgi:hypothetical protein